MNQISYTDAVDTMVMLIFAFDKTQLSKMCALIKVKAKALPVLDNATMTKHFDFMTNASLVRDDENGARAEIWYDDPTTLASKYAFSKTLGVKGVAFWTADEVSYDTGTLAKDMWDALASFASAAVPGVGASNSTSSSSC